jgi:pSer/pThr/pTyr-binding forkhead associated (FHA) protein
MRAMSLLIEVRLGPERGRKVALRPGQSITVGRTDADLVVTNDPGLSPRHFSLSWDGKIGALRDLGANGVLVNGVRREQTDVTHGTWIRAGASDFTLCIEGHTPQGGEVEDDLDSKSAFWLGTLDNTHPAFSSVSAMVDEAEQLESLAIRGNSLRILDQKRIVRRAEQRERSQRAQAGMSALGKLRETANAGALHAVFDAARTDRILTVLREAIEEHRSLYEGIQGIALEEVAPYLVKFSPDSRLLGQVIEEGWMNNWGIYLEGDVPERELRRHLRRFLMVKDEDGESFYFRFYDPACLRDFWPTCGRRQCEELIGPLDAYLVEGERGELLRLTKDGAITPAVPSL